MSSEITATAYDELVEAIVKAVPNKITHHWMRLEYLGQDICTYQCGYCEFEDESSGEGEHKDVCPKLPTITLEDVLGVLATLDKHLIAVTLLGQFVFIEKMNLVMRLANCQWELGLPLSDQSEDCKAFLHSLLCV